MCYTDDFMLPENMAPLIIMPGSFSAMERGLQSLT